MTFKRVTVDLRHASSSVNSNGVATQTSSQALQQEPLPDFYRTMWVVFLAETKESI